MYGWLHTFGRKAHTHNAKDSINPHIYILHSFIVNQLQGNVFFFFEYQCPSLSSWFTVLNVWKCSFFKPINHDRDKLEFVVIWKYFCGSAALQRTNLKIIWFNVFYLYNWYKKYSLESAKEFVVKKNFSAEIFAKFSYVILVFACC